MDTKEFDNSTSLCHSSICSFNIQFRTGRTSHYSKKKTNKLYLPEELNVTKMYNLYKEKYSRKPVSYETYRTIFTTKFNIAIGFPRCDTCSSCDEFNATLKVLGSKLSETLDVEEKDDIDSEIRRKTIENEVHKKNSMNNVDAEAVCIGFQKNLPLPNITTTDVYYKRQLSFYSFNIHRLSDADSVFYTYTEVAKKGANEFFPIRGHSYMECDKYMGLISCKTRTELPEDWVEIFRSARQKSSPFKVEEVDQERLQIPLEKYEDLQHLKKYCGPAAQEYFNNWLENDAKKTTTRKSKEVKKNGN
ncbi:hypothetical protein JTB14_021598 [Gonioctena quinquepunctata]|nr:hypothetical protein JTB14_021598 [Gonioctena quinquepunctata]